MKGLETFVDWYAGIGGFRIAAENNGLNCMASCDNDPPARQTYKKNFGKEPEFNDAREVDIGKVPEHDLYCAGFPCPAFSIAGRRSGFADERGILFFEILRVLEAKQPNYFLLENVRGILSAPYLDEAGDKIPGTSGWVFLRVLEELGNLGYTVQWQLLYSRHWVPQDRQRVYIVGNSRAVPFPEVFPLFDYAEKMEGHTRRESGSLGRLHRHQGGRVYGPHSIGPTLTAGDKAPYVYTNGSLRLLTPEERERMQGFPVGWTAGVSDTQRMKQLGNAITVQVAQEVIRRLVECHANGGRRPEPQAIG